MNAIKPAMVVSFIVITALNLAGLTLLPRTQGFTDPGVTAAMLALFAVSYWLIARIVQSGANLGILIPLMSTVIPLATVAIGILLYGESGSPVRIG
jgi:multidrug transporter EmrE-like cation transporter